MNFIERRLSRLQHLSDEAVSRLLSGELNTIRAVNARSHIAKCWRCRSRYEVLDRVAMQVAGYRKFVTGMIPPDSQRREMLLADLRRRSEGRVQRTRPAHTIFHFNRLRSQMTPLLASVAIVVSAVCLLVWVWRTPAPSVNAAQLLDRAVSADQAVSRQRSGVIYQKVSITTTHSRVEHEIYRDLRSVRHRRPESLEANAEAVQKVLASVGVDWQAPLSANSFQQWHNHQHVISDQIRKAGGDLITVVSKVSGGPIEEESLTVRTSDFHPVERTVESRDYGTIEIAELNYAVLDWSSVNEALFEPLSGRPHAVPAILPALPTEEELIRAELEARLALNRLHADEGEQISISLTSHAVEIKGVVETEKRKHEIVSGLSNIPLVAANVLSLDELSTVTPDSSIGSPVQVRSMDGLSSPLEDYLVEKGRRSYLETVSRNLLDASLKVKQNATQILSLRKTFASEADTRNPAFTGLLQSYAERLQSNLSLELTTLDTLQVVSPGAETANPAAANLQAAVDANEVLCRELIAGSQGSPRTTAEIVPDIYKAITTIRLALAAQMLSHAN